MFRCFTLKRTKKMKMLITHISALLVVLSLFASCASGDGFAEDPMADNTMNDGQVVSRYVFEASWSAEQQVVDTATVDLRWSSAQADVSLSRLPCEWLLQKCGLAQADGKNVDEVRPAAFRATVVPEGYVQGSSNNHHANTVYYSLPPQNYSFEATIGQQACQVEVELNGINLVVTTNNQGMNPERVSLVANVSKMTCRNGSGQTIKELTTGQTLVLNTTKRK